MGIELYPIRVVLISRWCIELNLITTITTITTIKTIKTIKTT